MYDFRKPRRAGHKASFDQALGLVADRARAVARLAGSRGDEARGERAAARRAAGAERAAAAFLELEARGEHGGTWPPRVAPRVPLARVRWLEGVPPELYDGDDWRAQVTAWRLAHRLSH